MAVAVVVVAVAAAVEVARRWGHVSGLSTCRMTGFTTATAAVVADSPTSRRVTTTTVLSWVTVLVTSKGIDRSTVQSTDDGLTTEMTLAASVGVKKDVSKGWLPMTMTVGSVANI